MQGIYGWKFKIIARYANKLHGHPDEPSQTSPFIELTKLVTAWDFAIHLIHSRHESQYKQHICSEIVRRNRGEIPKETNGS